MAAIFREPVDPQESASRVARVLDDAVHAMGLYVDQSRSANLRVANYLVAWHELSYARGGSPLVDDEKS